MDCFYKLYFQEAGEWLKETRIYTQRKSILASFIYFNAILFLKEYGFHEMSFTESVQMRLIGSINSLLTTTTYLAYLDFLGKPLGIDKESNYFARMALEVLGLETFGTACYMDIAAYTVESQVDAAGAIESVALLNIPLAIGWFAFRNWFNGEEMQANMINIE